MKLIDLNPRWVGLHNWCSDSQYYIGLSFDSPRNPGQRLAVLFYPALDPDDLASIYHLGDPFPDARKWDRTGTNFETLTLSPSLDFSPNEWHGSIINGELV